MQFLKHTLATSSLQNRNCLLGRGLSVSRSKERPEALKLDANEDANCLDEQRSYVSTQKKKQVSTNCFNSLISLEATSLTLPNTDSGPLWKSILALFFAEQFYVALAEF